MRLTSALAVALMVLGAAARAELPPLVEQELLPAVGEPPTCACVVEGDSGRGRADGRERESDFVVVGNAGGHLIAFQRVSGRSARASSMELAGRGPVESVAGVAFPEGAGPGRYHAILAAQGRTISAVSFEDTKVMGSCELPPPAGAYRLAPLGTARALAYDDASAWVLTLGGASEGWSVRAERVLSSGGGLLAGAQRAGSVAALGDGRLYLVTDSGVQDLGEPPLGGMDTAGPLVCTERFVAGVEGGSPDALRLLVRARSGAWAAGSLTMPGPVTTLEAASDTTLLAGGATADTTGWVALVDRRGVLLATGAHAVAPAHACVMDGMFVVHGEDGNLTVFDASLESLWDQASRFVTPVALLALDYDGDGFEDAALVGARTVRSSKAETDSLRKYLRKPDIMAGARLVERGGNLWYEREETHAEVLLSRRAVLVRVSGEREREARDALDEGDEEAALALLSEARAASAAVGDRARVASLTCTLADWTTRGRRTLSTFVAAAALALAGALYAAGRARGLVGARACVVLAVLLLAVGAVAWRLFGWLPWTPLLAVGGLAPLGAVAWRAAGARGGTAPHPSAPIDELREVVAAFIHAVDDDLRSVGRVVTDAPRKTVTALAALAEDMRKSLDSPEQYQALLDRVRVRGETFRKVVLPQLDHIAWLAGRARFLILEAKAMRSAGVRIADALDVLLRAEPVDRALLDGELRAIPQARLELVAAAERAWEDLKANPGCSFLAVFEYVANEKKEEMGRVGVSLATRFDLRRGTDAVRIAHHELYGILENLFTNALRATGGARRREIVVSARHEAGACRIRFADTGKGMSAEQAAAIFSQTHGDVRGGGWGLPQARRVLRKYGGDIAVEKSEAGKGTTFLLVVPHWSPLLLSAEAATI